MIKDKKMTLKIQSLNVRNKTFIVTTARVDQNDIYSYIKKRVKGKEFAKGSIFKIYSGAHGYHDGRLGDRASDTWQFELDTESQIKMHEEDVIDVLQVKELGDEELHDEVREAREATAEIIRKNQERKN